MLVYSKKIMQFIQEIEQLIRSILMQEVRLRVERTRFYDRQQHTSYPIKVVIFNTNKSWGYFDPVFYEMGFHESLMRASKEFLRDIVRHELAHYISLINHGPYIEPHGEEFHTFCRRMGWGEQVYKASACMEFAQEAPQKEEDSILRKVQKLMALSSSSNQHEAEQAMIKSQQLLLKHSIDAKYVSAEEEEKVFLKRLMQRKKRDAKMQAVSQILQTFFVNVVFSHAKGFICLEVLGDAVHVEIAEYVAAVLDTELDKLWAHAQRTTPLRGITARNSFLLGIAHGYCNKVSALKKDYTGDVSNALMVIEKKLVAAKQMVYPRLTSTKSRRGYCAESALMGEQMGRSLTINPALNKTPKNSGGLLTYC
jgi:hypothetical protein